MKVAKCQKNIHTWHFSYDVPRANVELNIATFFSVCEVVLWCSVAALLLQKRIIFHPQKTLDYRTNTWQVCQITRLVL